MNVMTFILTFTMFWMIIFLIMLPLKIKEAANIQSGNDPGAPEIHYFKEKFYLSIAIAIVLTIAYWYIFYFQT